MVEILHLAPEPPAAAKPAPPKPRPPRTLVKRKPAPPDVEPLPALTAELAKVGPGLSDSDLAGAATAGSGGGAGGACDMIGRVQAALRKDPLVMTAVAGSTSRATLVWNGDWVRSQGEDGKGLAAVREAIMWEVAFAPSACRAQPMRGLVLISVSGAGGSARLALGTGAWRWSDLLTPRSAPAG